MIVKKWRTTLRVRTGTGACWGLGSVLLEISVILGRSAMPAYNADSSCFDRQRNSY